MLCKEKYKSSGIVSMNIRVEIAGMETVTLKVKPDTATVSEVIDKLRQRLGLDLFEPLYLTHEGKLLSFFSTLKSYRIKSGTTLRLDCSFTQLGRQPPKPEVAVRKP